MTANMYTGGDPRKVDVAGDTMTGDLILAGAGTDLRVEGSTTTTFQGVTGDITQLTSTALSTGVISGGLLSINANPALIDISPMTGWIVNYDPTGTIGPTSPQLTEVTYPGATGVAITGSLTNNLRHWLISPAGALIQQLTLPTAAERRQNIMLGTTVQFGGINTQAINLPTTLSQPAAQFVDLVDSLGPFTMFGTDNTISPNGVNRSINTTGGRQFNRSFQATNYLNPHVTTTAAQSPAIFRRATATTIFATVQNTIDVANYDPAGAGVITPIGGGVNTTSIHYVFVWGFAALADQMVVQYGQQVYASLDAAQAAIAKGVYLVNQLFYDGSLAGWICATRSATNLSDPTQARFIKAPKFATP